MMTKARLEIETRFNVAAFGVLGYENVRILSDYGSRLYIFNATKEQALHLIKNCE